MKRTEARYPLQKMMLVEWRDSSSRGQWDSVDEYKRGSHLGPIQSVGFVLESTKDRLILIQSQSSHTWHICDSITIPAEAIVRKRILRE